MRFAVPVNDASEIPALQAGGADELYCGYQDAAWQDSFGGHDSASRRQGRANLSDAAALREVAQTARSCGLPIHLTLNGRVSEGMLPDLERIAALWYDAGGYGIILRDPMLLRRLKKAIPIRYTVSLLAAVVNADGAALWRDWGADRLVFPRGLSPEEMGEIACAVPELEYEAMVMGDKCPFVDGFCRSIHAQGFLPAESGEMPTAMRETWNPMGQAFHLCTELCETVPDPCAACALRMLSEGGIHVGKLGGRGQPLDMRLRWLRFLRAAQVCRDREARQALYRETFGHPCRCYYEEHTHTACHPAGKAGQLGHHACPGALPEMTEVLERDSPDAARLVIPPVTPQHAGALEQLLKAAALCRETELVCNDWGTLRRCSAWKRAHPGTRLILGALLTGQDTDPLLDVFLQPQPDRVVRDAGEAVRLHWCPPPEPLTEHWRTPSAVHWTALLRELGVDAVELCRQTLEPVEGLSGIAVTLLPYAILSVRPCNGNCAACGGRCITRGGRRLYWDRNLLLW